MPSELHRRPVLVAAAAFLLALAVAYALSSTGQASSTSGPPGSPAEPLDVASGVAGQSTLGEAEALPALVRRPQPPAPAPEPEPVEEPEPEPPAPVEPAPVEVPVTPVAPAPAPVQPTPPAPPPEPPVEFEDSG